LSENGNRWGSFTESRGHFMKKLLGLATLAATLSTLPAHAEVIDVSTVKCSELATMKPEEASYLFIWLHGYFGGQAGDTTIDLGAMEAVGTAIGEKCAANPELGLMTAIQQLGQ
jgi:acid stress chaperone HdeB